MQARLTRKPLTLFAGTAVLLGCTPAIVPAQQPPAPPAASAPAPGPVVGSMAPDFSLPGATRYGLLAEPVRLSQLRGHTVVLAFFSRARTRG